jgi:hypothetical protein
LSAGFGKPQSSRLDSCNHFSATQQVTTQTPHLTPHTTHHTPHTSHLTPHTSHLTPHTSHLTPHTSHLTPHTSHLTPHTSHLTPHTSHLTHLFHILMEQHVHHIGAHDGACSLRRCARCLVQRGGVVGERLDW